MELISISDATPHHPERFVAEPLLDGIGCNVRLIRLSPGQVLPPHTHEPSELMLYVAEGDAVLDTDSGEVPFVYGSLAWLQGSEELRVSNKGSAPVTLLAFLAPPFPPRTG
jgi:quercetin dioxygenase-like cupin family protein